MLASIISSKRRWSEMLAFSNDYYGFIFRVTQSVELFCTYECSVGQWEITVKSNVLSGYLRRKGDRPDTQGIWSFIPTGFKAKLGNAKDKYLSFCMGDSLSWWSDTIQNSRICDMEDKKKDGIWYYRNAGQCGVSVEKVIVFGRYNWDEMVCYYY